jgi:hypothetical protein
LGARINPDYFALKRATVERYPDGNRSTMAAIPENMDVKIGDLVELASRYRDRTLPCHFVPWTINRLVDDAEAERSQALPRRDGPTPTPTAAAPGSRAP